MALFAEQSQSNSPKLVKKRQVAELAWLGGLRPSTQVLREMTLKRRGKGSEARLIYDTKSDLWKNDPPLLP